MSKGWKITLYSLLALILVPIIAFIITVCIRNKDVFIHFFDGTQLHTQTDMENSYEDGYNTALSDKESYETIINQLKDKVINLTDSLSISQNKVTELTDENKLIVIQRDKFSLQVTELTKNVTELTAIKESNEELIENFKLKVNELKTALSVLEISDSSKSEEIKTLKLQILNFSSLIEQLQKVNELNTSTITSLNIQINGLNAKISELTIQSENNSSAVSLLNSRITELEKSVAYYEQFIAGLETGTQVVATYIFNNSVYVIQILNKNGIASVNNPTSTNYIQFNYWEHEGVRVDINTFQVTENTTFVANITYKYDVKFNMGETNTDSQIVVKNSFATLPTNPIKDGYEFLGWSKNGVDIINNINTIPVTENTTYYAVFAKLNPVQFLYEENILNTQNIKTGNYASDVTVENTTYKIFNGWKLNGVKVDVATVKITSAVTFVADITYKFDVIFNVGSEEFATQIVQENMKPISITAPIKDGYEFLGWSKNGIDIVIVENTTITSNTTFIAVFKQLNLVQFKNGDVIEHSLRVKTNEFATVPTNPTKENKVFVGWSKDGINVINILTTPIISDTVFIAVFRDYKVLNFNSHYDLFASSVDTDFLTDGKNWDDEFSYSAPGLNGINVLGVEFDVRFDYVDGEDLFTGPTHVSSKGQNTNHIYIDINEKQGMSIYFNAGSIGFSMDGTGYYGGNSVEFVNIIMANVKIYY